MAGVAFALCIAELSIREAIAVHLQAARLPALAMDCVLVRRLARAIRVQSCPRYVLSVCFRFPCASSDRRSDLLHATLLAGAVELHVRHVLVRCVLRRAGCQYFARDNPK